MKKTALFLILGALALCSAPSVANAQLVVRTHHVPHQNRVGNNFRQRQFFNRSYYYGGLQQQQLFQQQQFALNSYSASACQQQTFRQTFRQTFAAPSYSQGAYYSQGTCGGGGGVPPQQLFAPAPTGGCGTCGGGGVPSTQSMLQRFGY